MTDEKRQGAACRKGFRQICFLPLFCVSAILSKVWISARQFFSAFLFQYFSFLGSGCKSRIVCRRRSQSYSGGDKSLTRLPPTPPTCLPKPKKKYTPACQSKPERQTSYLSSSVFVFYRWFLHARFITLFTIWLYGMQSDFLLFHPNLSLFRLPPFGCGLHRIASVGRPRSGAKVISGCSAAARSVPSASEKISTPALDCILLRVVFSLKNLAFAHPYLCGGTWNENDRCDRKTH